MRARGGRVRRNPFRRSEVCEGSTARAVGPASRHRRGLRLLLRVVAHARQPAQSRRANDDAPAAGAYPF